MVRFPGLNKFLSANEMARTKPTSDAPERSSPGAQHTRNPAGMDAHRSAAEPPSVTVTLAEIDRDKNGHFRTRSTCFAPYASEAGPGCILSRAVSTLDGGMASRGSRSVARYASNTSITSMSIG